MRVLVVDRDEEALRSVADALLDLTNVTFGGAAGNVRTAISALAFHNIDVVVTDFDLDDGDALDIIEAARLVDPSPAVVVYAAVDIPSQARRCLAGGADLYLPRSGGIGQLQDGVLATATLRRRGRRPTPPGEPVDLGGLVIRVLEQAGRIIADAVTMPSSIEPDLPKVRGVPAQLEALVMDLVVEAIALRATHLAVRVRRSDAATVRIEVTGGEQSVVLGGADLPIWTPR